MASRVKVGDCGLVSNEEVSSVIQRVMGEEGGGIMKQRASELRAKAAHALSKEGRSNQAIAQVTTEWKTFLGQSKIKKMGKSFFKSVICLQFVSLIKCTIWLKCRFFRTVSLSRIVHHQHNSCGWATGEEQRWFQGKNNSTGHGDAASK